MIYNRRIAQKQFDVKINYSTRFDNMSQDDIIVVGKQIPTFLFWIDRDG